MDTRSAVGPSEGETLLLSACLWPGEAARGAWAAFRAAGDDLRAVFAEDRAGIRRLGPLLHAAVRRASLPIEPELRTRLHLAYVWEAQRVRRTRRSLADVLGGLREAGIESVVAGGAALGETLYGDPVLRHVHDIDLVVRRGARAVTAAVLRAAGFRPEHPDAGPGPSGVPVRWRDAAHVRLALRSSVAADGRDLAALRRSRPRALAGVPTRVLSTEDELLRACRLADGSFPGPVGLCDAWLLAGAQPDWAAVIRRATRTGRTRDALRVLAYLAGSLDAPVPEVTLRALSEAARRPMCRVARTPGNAVERATEDR